MPEPFNELQEFFYRTDRQDRQVRTIERGIIRIIVGGVICFALIVWLFPNR
jgi:hypothetical protein